MSFKDTIISLYHKTSFKIIAGFLVIVMFFTMVLQSATLIAINHSNDKSEAAVNYLVDNTEYVKQSRPERVKEYIKTLAPKDTLEDYYRLASTQIARKEYAKALTNINKCIDLYNNEGPDLYIDLILKRGCLQVMLGDYDSALKSLEIAQAKSPKSANIYLIKAQIYAEQKNMDAVAENLTEYIKLEPNDSTIRSVLAQAQFAKGDYDAAAQQYNKILEIKPNAETEYLYGLNAVKNSDFAVAEEYLTKAIAKDDSFDGIYYYRGVCRMSLEKYPSAIEDLTISIDRHDMLQVSYYTRGVCLIMDKQYEKGKADLKMAADNNEDQEVQKQAQLLLDQLAAAQTKDNVPSEGKAEPLEIKPPVIPVPTVEETGSKNEEPKSSTDKESGPSKEEPNSNTDN